MGPKLRFPAVHELEEAYPKTAHTWPTLFLPQHTTALFVDCSAQVCSPPAATMIIRTEAMFPDAKFRET
jgi:hypothetical protein